ncbi:periplasmic divalent cation tolerance protein [Desulfovibrionales bacterium]
MPSSELRIIMQTYLVYVITKSMVQSRDIGRALVERRLAACVNILPVVESLFWWDGRVQEVTEAAFIAKTTAAQLPALMDAVRSLHSYEVPCVIALLIADGNSAFLEWIVAETLPHGHLSGRRILLSS